MCLEDVRILPPSDLFSFYNIGLDRGWAIMQAVHIS